MATTILAEVGEFVILDVCYECALIVLGLRPVLSALRAVFDADGAAVGASESIEVAGDATIHLIFAVGTDCHRIPFVSRLGFGDGGTGLFNRLRESKDIKFANDRG